MADTALSFARDHLFPFLKNAFDMIKGLPKEVEDMKEDLENIQDFIHHADEEDKEATKRRVKKLIEIAFHMEDVIDEYMIHEQQNTGDDPGCAALCEIADFIKTMIPRLRIAYKVRDIKLQVDEIKQSSKSDNGFQIQSFNKQGPRRENQKSPMENQRQAPRYMGKDKIVGFEAPGDELVDWLMEGQEELTIISVIGMGGQGKTTLARKVYDNEEVVAHFGCRVWITVSQTYTTEGVLRNMLKQRLKQIDEVINEEVISKMDRQSSIDEVRKHLQGVRYVVFFDDVWDEHFWYEIEFALVDEKKGSRILITSRHMKVAESCKRFSSIKIHKLQPLSLEQSWTLFCKKVFKHEQCPEELKPISFDIVAKCDGLPLAIVVIGGLLAEKNYTLDEWQKFYRALQKNQNIDTITKILGLSYNDLPYYLKSCFLYFGTYSEDYEIKLKRLIGQWIAEGFVDDEVGNTLEEVAEKYLQELIDRSLVQVSSFTIDGKVRSCRVHDLTHDMILKKMEFLRFCHSVHDQSKLNGTIRRLSITTSSNGLISCSDQSSHTRSLFVFTDELPEHFIRKIPAKYKLLKVLDFENSVVLNVPENLGNLIHLKYLSFRNTWVGSIPDSIAKLHNLETLDLRGTTLTEMPKGISKLKKLRHFLFHHMPLIYGKDDGIGSMTSLQTLGKVEIHGNGVESINDLGRLTQLRKLHLEGVSEEEGSALCSSISKMEHLQNLLINSSFGDDVLGSLFNSSPPMLRKLSLQSPSTKLPQWLLKLQNLVQLKLRSFQLTDDPMKSLKCLPNLLSLYLIEYDGVSLHFQDGGFKKLKDLGLSLMDNLNSIYVDKGVLDSLESLWLCSIPKLEAIPSSLQHLKKLKVLRVDDMSAEFEHNIAPIGGPEHLGIQHVPLVKITNYDGTLIIHPSRRN